MKNATVIASPGKVASPATVASPGKVASGSATAGPGVDLCIRDDHKTGEDHGTRDRVCQLLLERGAATAAELGAALGLSPAAIRRHLDAMLNNGDVTAREQRVPGNRGRGRPARSS